MRKRLSFIKNEHNNLTDVEIGSLGGGRPLWMKVLHRVAPKMREKKKHIYDPSVTSLGPYHHGQPQCRRFEEFKHKAVNVTLKDGERRMLFRSKVLERIDDIRYFYGGLPRDKLDDEALADMMVRDSCTVLYYMELNVMIDDEEYMDRYMLMFQHLGLFQVYELWVDILKLENQIPWWLINLLISLAYNDDHKEQGEELVRRFLSYQIFGNLVDMKKVPWDEDDDDQPLHLLEALRNTNVLIVDAIDGIEERLENMIDIFEDNPSPSPSPPFKCKWWRSNNSSSTGDLLHARNRSFRSVRELKAKGIHFKPSSCFLIDIRFNSYYVFGVLHLPILGVSRDTGIAFSNAMALEMCPGSPCVDAILTSYVTFMKSMIDSSEDVKLLQEKGIIVSFVEDNEEIVKMFKEMDTYGMDMVPVYDDIKIRINQHCDSKAKTWIAELTNTNFHSPWAVVALAAATLLLCLTFLQTYYTMKPRNTAI